MFVEAKSEKGAIVGYVKPFLTNVDVIENKEQFRGAKHFLAEVGAALSNVILKKPKLKSLATKIDFKREGPQADFQVDALGAISNAVEHRLDQPIAPNIEDEVTLK